MPRAAHTTATAQPLALARPGPGPAGAPGTATETPGNTAATGMIRVPGADARITAAYRAALDPAHQIDRAETLDQAADRITAGVALTTITARARSAY